MKTRAIFLTIVAVFTLAIVGCTEDIDESARYVFKDQTAMGYLQKHPETYSNYVDLLNKVRISDMSQSTVGQLLAARGHYTVFAPTNEAIQAYLDTLVAQGVISQPSWDAFTDSVKLDSIRQIVVLNSHIIKNGFIMC